MDREIVCNFKKCRKRLNTLAWVTSCSHIFCNEDGAREFEKSLICPACETTLSHKFDIIRVDLNPSEQYKSMVLTGQRPDIILEVCTRALSFWIYQVHQEILYQEFLVTKSKDRSNQLEKFYEQAINKAKMEINSLKQQLEGSRKELEIQKRRMNELAEKLMEKSRQHQKLQTMYETLRRKCISPSMFEKDSHERNPRNLQFYTLPLATASDVLKSNNSDGVEAGSLHEKFVLKPQILTPAEMDNAAFNIGLPCNPPMNSSQCQFTLNLVTPHRDATTRGQQRNK